MNTFKRQALKSVLGPGCMAVGGIEKRLRKEIRAQRVDYDELFLIDTKTVEVKVLKSLLKNIFQGRIKISLVPANTKKRKNVFLPSSLENELVRELRNFLEDKDEENKFVPLLTTVPEAMILEFAKRHKIAGKTLTPQDDVREMLETLQEGQPQTKSALRKSFAWLKEQTEK
ncbi:hypothetical protein GOV07_05310 [Candidatus Woesearchaeota archaeon]|nr:hypothetical protein [Candidatus Woesearchaeota archaeon]